MQTRNFFRRLVLLLALLAPALAGVPSLATAAVIQSRAAFVPRGTDVRKVRLGVQHIRQAVAAYAKRRGFRPDNIGVELLGLTESGKSTRAVLHVDGQRVVVAINHGTGRVQSRHTAGLIETLLAAHAPYKRVEVAEASRFANMLVGFKPGAGAVLGAARLGRGIAAPLGRPRVGQSIAAQALDAPSLGDNGSITVALGRDIVAGRPGAAVRVRENGFGDANGDILNQTPGLVEVMVGNTWHRLGYAGYKAAGEMLLLSNALDPIPVGSVISVVRVTDAPNAPHPRGLDPTDNAVAVARGVKGFDLVSVEGMDGMVGKLGPTQKTLAKVGR